MGDEADHELHILCALPEQMIPNNILITLQFWQHLVGLRLLPNLVFHFFVHFTSTK